MSQGQSYLIIKGAAGLGNRLFSIANGIEYAKKTQRTVLVDWSDGQFALRGTDAFKLCFQMKGIAHITCIKELPETITSSYPPDWGLFPEKNVYEIYRLAEPDFSNRSFFRRFFRLLPQRGYLKKLKRYWYIDFEHRKKISNTFSEAIRALFSKRDFCVGGDLPFHLNQTVVFHVDYCPLANEDILRHTIQLQADMQEKVDYFSQRYNLGTNTIGVHVRMTDAQPTSSLDVLLQKISKITLKYPKIFLATDNDKAIIFFREHFSNIITIPKLSIILPEKIGRHSYASFSRQPELAEVIYRESVMDMFLLSRCEWLIAQKNSSFSKISAIYKNDPTKTLYW